MCRILHCCSFSRVEEGAASAAEEQQHRRGSVVERRGNHFALPPPLPHLLCSSLVCSFREWEEEEWPWLKVLAGGLWACPQGQFVRGAPLPVPAILAAASGGADGCGDVNAGCERLSGGAGGKGPGEVGAGRNGGGAEWDGNRGRGAGGLWFQWQFCRFLLPRQTVPQLLS